MKKILYVSHSAVTPFHLKKVEELSKYYQILLITPFYGKEEGVIHHVKHNKINKNFEHYPLYYLYPLKIYFSFPPFIFKTILSYKPDLLYIEEEPMSFCAFYLLIIKMLICPKIPIIYYTYENINFSWFFKFPKYFFYNTFKELVLKKCDGVVVPTELNINFLKKYKVKKTIIAQYGIEENWLKYECKSSNSNLLKIGFIGRLIEEKGILFLLHSLQDVKISYELHIIGSGYLKERILDLINEKKINAVFHGHTSHELLADIISLLDCIIIPSFTIKTWREQFGRVIIETLALGKIVIGSNSGAIPYVIKDYGFIFKEGNKKDLIEVLTNIYNKNININKQNIYKYVRANYSLDAVTIKLKQFFDNYLFP